MGEISDESVHLIITSPPYWQLKDYGSTDQIGFNNSYAEYHEGLNKVWDESYRILHPGCRICINIGDQFARAIFYGRYKVIPIRTEIIKHCESIGFDYMGAIIWQKVTTCQTTGGATVMGSYPYPRGGIIKIDYEFILIFKKLGREPKVSKEIKEKSRLTNEEWNEYFNGHWNFPGERQNGHIAMFPLELPKRLIKMFSFVGDTVLDPFLGSGTTSKAALELGRNSVGYEINPEFIEIIKSKIGFRHDLGLETQNFDYDIIFQDTQNSEPKSPSISIKTNHIERIADPKQFNFGTAIDLNGKSKRQDTFKVMAIPEANRIILESGLSIVLLGILPDESMQSRKAAIDYLKEMINGKRIVLKYDSTKYDSNNRLLAYVYLPNKTFLNAKLVARGLAYADRKAEYSYRDRFEKYEDEARSQRIGIWVERI